MNRFLVIDGDRLAMQALGLSCVQHGVGLTMAENLCEGVRALLNDGFSLIVVDAAQLRLTAREHATLFERVAPEVPVAVVVRPETALDVRVAFELAGFHVFTGPVTAELLVAKTAAWRSDSGR